MYYGTILAAYRHAGMPFRHAVTAIPALVHGNHSHRAHTHLHERGCAALSTASSESMGPEIVAGSGPAFPVCTGSCDGSRPGCMVQSGPVHCDGTVIF